MGRREKPVIYLDTHSLVFLHSGGLNPFGEKASPLIEEGLLYCPPIVLIELNFLFQKKRITQPPDKIFSKVSNELDVRLSPTPYIDLVRRGLQINWTRDPFDLLITAEVIDQPNHFLITKDELILANCREAVW